MEQQVDFLSSDWAWIWRDDSEMPLYWLLFGHVQVLYSRFQYWASNQTKLAAKKGFLERVYRVVMR